MNKSTARVIAKNEFIDVTVMSDYDFVQERLIYIFRGIFEVQYGGL
jgi:hypothetical protein